MDAPDRTDRMLMHGQTLVLQPTLGCNVLCRHCLVSGEPRRGRVMTIAEGKRLIDEYRSLPLACFVGFTGGEVFLHHDLLVELGRYASERIGCKFAVSTNASWASTEQAATRLLQPLVAAGLKYLMISIDDLHLEFVPERRIVTAVNAAFALGITVTAQTVLTKNGRTAEQLRSALGLPPPSDRFVWTEFRCHPVGRGATELRQEEIWTDWSNRVDSCSALRIWTVDPDGWVRPCCGTARATVLRAGNAFETPLREIAKAANVDPLFNTIAAWGGPYMLIRHLEKLRDRRFSDRTFSSNCHACDAVLSDAAALERIRPVLEEHRVEAIAARVATQRALHLAEDARSVVLPGGWV